MYDADPFAARKSVAERQERAAKKRETQQSATAPAPRSEPNIFDNSPEVKLSSELRGLVENAIKMVIVFCHFTCIYRSHLYQAIANSSEDEVTASPTATITEDNAPVILRQLEGLGFKKSRARDAIAFLSEPSPLTSNLLGAASPLEACIEYLVLHTPEVDLPQRFLPENNSSNPFVTSIHEGQEDIKKRWIEERAIKQAGWPAHIEYECTAESRLLEEWALLIAALNRRLVGEPWLDVAMQPDGGDEEERMTEDEIESMGASYADDGTFTLVMPLFIAPVQLHFVIPPGYSYNRSSRPPPMYVTASSVPAYVRLHLLAKLLEAFEQGIIKESAESICVSAMQVLEEHWAVIEDQGPPNMDDVLKCLVPPQEVQDITVAPIVNVPSKSMPWKTRNGFSSVGRDLRSDAEVIQAFDAMRQDEGYEKMHATRSRLPAFASKDDFLTMLEQSRVVVVVGETGSGKTTQRECVPIRQTRFIYA